VSVELWAKLDIAVARTNVASNTIGREITRFDMVLLLNLIGKLDIAIPQH
jgi:hypothetical protein